MSEFSINDKRKIKEEVLEMENVKHEDVVETTEVPKIELENEQVYKLAVNGMREKLVELVKEGFMTESVAERLMNEFMLNTFNQVVKPKLV